MLCPLSAVNFVKFGKRPSPLFGFLIGLRFWQFKADLRFGVPRFGFVTFRWEGVGDVRQHRLTIVVPKCRAAVGRLTGGACFFLEEVKEVATPGNVSAAAGAPSLSVVGVRGIDLGVVLPRAA